MSMEVAHRIGWFWDVEFARWVSPDSTSLKVSVVAETAEDALSEGRACALRIWRDESNNLEVRRLARRDPVNGVAPGTKGTP